MAVETADYYPAPYSLSSLTPSIHAGLCVIGSLATLSLVLTTVGISLITLRLIKWYKSGRAFLIHNQCVVLIYNLLFADMFQAWGFVISFHWIQKDGILAPTTACWVQASFLQMGDVSSAFFVLAVAIHTLYAVIRGRKMGSRAFGAMIALIWVVAVMLTIFGPLAHGKDFFTCAGNWCWISDKYDAERLWLHYLWIFLVEFGSVVIYAGIFIYMRHTLASTRQNAPRTARAVESATRDMIAYPAAYVVLTLPLATARMIMLSGNVPPNKVLIAAGVMLASTGWVDTVLYLTVRQALASDTHTNHEEPLNHMTRHLVLTPRMSLGIHGNFTQIDGGPSTISDPEERAQFERDLKELWERPASPKLETQDANNPQLPPKRARIVEATTTISVYETANCDLSQTALGETAGADSRWHSWEGRSSGCGPRGRASVG